MDRSEKFWDGRAREYDRNENKYESMYSKTVFNTESYLHDGDTVLDYGCGTGLMTNEIAGSVKEIHAIDISSGMIEVAKRKADELGINNVCYEQSNIYDEKFEQGSFDAILAFNVLHLIEDNQAVIRRINELIKPGGYFLSTTACMGEKKSLLSMFLLLMTKIRIVPFMHYYKVHVLEDLVTKGNFRIIETETFRHVAPNHFIAARKVSGSLTIDRN